MLIITSFRNTAVLCRTNGHLFAFEINGVLNSSPLLWERTISDTCSGGAWQFTEANATNSTRFFCSYAP